MLHWAPDRNFFCKEQLAFITDLLYECPLETNLFDILAKLELMRVEERYHIHAISFEQIL